MKIKATLVSATHESKYGVSGYAALVKKNQSVADAIELIKSQCDYDENKTDEYFDSNMSEIVIDTDDYKTVEPVSDIYYVRDANDINGPIFAVCSTEDKAKHAEKLLKSAGFGCTEIVKSTINLDRMVIDDKTIDL